MKSKPEYWYKQSAVIPFRNTEDGVEVLLITSIKKKKWIFPKGIVEENLTSRESSIKEAFEEAGIKGELLPQKFGKYKYKKWGGTCKVKVYALNVDTVFDSWAEEFRERKWVKLREVDKFIKSKKLLNIVDQFYNSLDNKLR